MPPRERVPRMRQEVFMEELQQELVCFKQQVKRWTQRVQEHQPFFYCSEKYWWKDLKKEKERWQDKLSRLEQKVLAEMWRRERQQCSRRLVQHKVVDLPRVLDQTTEPQSSSMPWCDNPFYGEKPIYDEDEDHDQEEEDGKESGSSIEDPLLQATTMAVFDKYDNDAIEIASPNIDQDDKPIYDDDILLGAQDEEYIDVFALLASHQDSENKLEESWPKVEDKLQEEEVNAKGLTRTLEEETHEFLDGDSKERSFLVESQVFLVEENPLEASPSGSTQLSEISQDVQQLFSIQGRFPELAKGYMKEDSNQVIDFFLRMNARIQSKESRWLIWRHSMYQNTLPPGENDAGASRKILGGVNLPTQVTNSLTKQSFPSNITIGHVSKPCPASISKEYQFQPWFQVLDSTPASPCHGCSSFCVSSATRKQEAVQHPWISLQEQLGSTRSSLFDCLSQNRDSFLYPRARPVQGGSFMFGN